MKTTKLIIALLMASFVGRSQCTITASPDLNVCLDDVVTITANGATEYTFVAGPATNYNTSGNFTNSFKWNTIVYISGKVGVCVATATVNVLTSACTGMNELSITEEGAIYYDLQGNVIKPRCNELIIKQVGSVRKKVVIIDTP